MPAGTDFSRPGSRFRELRPETGPGWTVPMVSEHIVLGPSSARPGRRPGPNPAGYAPACPATSTAATPGPARWSSQRESPPPTRTRIPAFVRPGASWISTPLAAHPPLAAAEGPGPLLETGSSGGLGSWSPAHGEPGTGTITTAPPPRPSPFGQRGRSWTSTLIILAQSLDGPSPSKPWAGSITSFGPIFGPSPRRPPRRGPDLWFVPVRAWPTPGLESPALGPRNGSGFHNPARPARGLAPAGGGVTAAGGGPGHELGTWGPVHPPACFPFPPVPEAGGGTWIRPPAGPAGVPAPAGPAGLHHRSGVKPVAVHRRQNRGPIGARFPLCRPRTWRPRGGVSWGELLTVDRLPSRTILAHPGGGHGPA